MTQEQTPFDQAFPQSGGSFVREPDGSLTQVEGPQDQVEPTIEGGSE